MDAQLQAFLDTLGEAERAGGRALHEIAALARSSELRELLKRVGHDEGYYAAELAAHVRRLGGTPSTATGDFAEKVRAVSGLVAKLELLNRGQRWVIRKIEETLASVTDDGVRAFLKVMVRDHRANIEAVEEALKRGLS